MTWIALLWLGCRNAPPDAGITPLQRLTPTEYNRTVAELLGLDIHETHWRFPDEPGVAGFEGMAAGQPASPLLLERYAAAAAELAPRAMRSSRMFVCEDYGTLDADDRSTCARESIERFAKRAYRRPLDDDEHQRLIQLFEDANTRHGPDAAVIVSVQAILQSPKFYFRPTFAAERSGSLSSWEMASRLSYFLWDSMPDEDLFEAASKDKLRTEGQVRRQARRMLKDRRARDAVLRFHRQWLELDKLLQATPDLDTHAATYIPDIDDYEDPDFPEAKEEVWTSSVIGMRIALLHETDRFIETTLFDGPGTLGALLTGTEGFVSRIDSLDGAVGTEGIWGVSAGESTPDSAFETDDGNVFYAIETFPALWPADQRAGVLTSPAWLMGHAHPVHPAPVFRGVFVLERLLCQDVGQPPAEAAGAVVPDSQSATGTNRERITEMTSEPVCAGCHDRINPLGFAFENYDSVGGFRTSDNGSPVDASGRFNTPAGTETFDDAVALMEKLAQTPAVHDCYARQWTDYALGASVDADDPALAPILSSFRDRGRVDELLVDIVTSDLFRGGAR